MANKVSGRSVAVKLSLLAVAMLGFSYAMVPMYRSACDIGLINPMRIDPSNPYANINTNVDTSNTQVDKARWITVEFVANMNDKMPWNFAPQQKSVKIHPGEMTNVVYDVVNTTNREIVGVAIPSYGPALAVEYFKKVECFCFTKQTMAPNEKRGMPVVFVVTPDLPRDVNTITLSYTFFEVKS
ncbi:MAG TPA: cytochrome c oxidase assembly protein [Gallionellaceae bacterium]|nr:cytochrome c oxidase assembly protein [Gallionellaceae bacterium]